MSWRTSTYLSDGSAPSYLHFFSRLRKRSNLQSNSYELLNPSEQSHRAQALRKRQTKMVHMPKIYNTYFLAMVATLGGMLFGFDISSMSAIIGTKQYTDYFNNPSGATQGAIGSALAAGSVVGSLCAGPLSNRIGRRDAIFVGTIFWLIGTSVQVSCSGIGSLIAGRIINGLCVGVTSAQIARKEKRGSVLIIQQLAIEFGILIMFFIGYGCSFIRTTPTASFRTAWAMQYIPAVFLLIGIPFLPRSPRWLAKVGRNEEAILILAKIQAGGNIHDPLVVAEWKEITTVLEAERNELPGWRKFFYKGMWKRTLAGLSVQAWQQLSGANVMTYYVVYVFNVNMISSGVQYALFIIFTGIMFLIVDKVGRRELLIWGALGMGMCLFVVGGVLGKYSYPGDVEGNPNVTIKVQGGPSHVVIAFSYLLIIIYALTLAPVAWIYAAEVWSLGTRATGMSLAATSNWVFNFALGMFVPPAFKSISYWTFIIFGFFCMLAAIHAFFGYPETCNKSLEEIEFLFGENAPKPWHTKRGESILDERVHIAADEKRQSEFEEHAL